MSQKNQDRTKYRIQLFTQVTTIMFSTIFFSKLVVLNHYKKFNIPIKLFFAFLYTSTLDPLVIGGSYWVTRRYQHLKQLEELDKENEDIDQKNKDK